MNPKRLLAMVALIGAGAAGAHVMGYPLDPRDWPLGESVCSRDGGDFMIEDRTFLSRFTPLREADWIRFDADGRNMRVSGRSSITDVPIGTLDRIAFYPDGVEVLLHAGLTEKTELFFPTAAADCQSLYGAYRARHPHLLLKGG